VFRICGEKESKGFRVINAHIGSPSHEPPIKISSILRSIEKAGSEYLPFEGMDATRKKVAEFSKRFLGRDMDWRRIFITNGGVQALSISFLALRNKKPLIPSPAFPQYFDQMSLLDINYDIYNSVSEDLVNEITGKLSSDIGAVLINYPNNPTGYVPDNSMLIDLWDELRRKNILLINDAAYSQLYFDLKPAVPGDIIVDTFSKTFGVPGLRLGYLYWEAEEIERVSKIVYLSSAGVSEISQIVLNELISNASEEYFSEVRGYYRRKRDLISSMLKEEGFVFPEPRGAFYIFASHERMKSSEELAERLLSRNDAVVGIVPGGAFGSSEKWFRISYGKLSEVDLLDLVKILSEEIRGSQSG
jgi:aspartate/methionine/tyrosine aminotransferase